LAGGGGGKRRRKCITLLGSGATDLMPMKIATTENNIFYYYD